MSRTNEDFWSALPAKAIHPIRVPMVEALRWIGAPLSAIATVDVLDGYLSMSEAAHHLQALEALDVVEPVWPPGQPTTRREVFEAPYRLRVAKDHRHTGGEGQG